MKIQLRPKSKTDFQSDQPLAQPTRFKHLPLVILSLLILNLLATCNNSRAARMAAKSQPYIYVANATDGTTVEAKPKDPLYRPESVVASFTEDWLMLAYTWKEPPEKGNAFVSERGIDLPYQLQAASLAIVPGYREAYLDSTAKQYQTEFPFRNYNTGQQQAYVRIFVPPKVKPVDKGVWDVTIVATRTHATGKSIIAHEIFNHVIRVKAIKSSSGDKKLWGDRDTQLGKLLNEMQLQGLQIIEINKF